MSGITRGAPAERDWYGQVKIEKDWVKEHERSEVEAALRLELEGLESDLLKEIYGA